MDNVVCACLGITEEDVKTAVENGATTLEALKEATEAGSICGCCDDELETTLHTFL